MGNLVEVVDVGHEEFNPPDWTNVRCSIAGSSKWPVMSDKSVLPLTHAYRRKRLTHTYIFGQRTEAYCADGGSNT